MNVKQSLGWNNSDHDKLNTFAKGSAKARFDAEEGHSFDLINEYLDRAQPHAVADFFDPKSLVADQGSAPHLLKNAAHTVGQTDRGYAWVFTRRWTEHARPASAHDNNGTLIVVGVRHRDGWDKFWLEFKYCGKPMTGVGTELAPPSRCTYELGTEKAPDPERNVALVFNVPDAALKAALDAVGGQAFTPGVNTIPLLIECHWELQYDEDHGNKRGFKHDCFCGVNIKGAIPLAELFRGPLADYGLLNKTKYISITDQSPLMGPEDEEEPALVEHVSSIETEAEFAIDETDAKAVHALNQFIADLWEHAGFDEDSGKRWVELEKTFKGVTIEPKAGLPPDLAAPGWTLRHVPKYWRGFEEKVPKGLTQALRFNPAETNELSALDLHVSDSKAVKVMAPWTLSDYYFDSDDALILRNAGSLRLRCNARGWNLLNVKSMSIALDAAATVRFCANLQLVNSANWDPTAPEYAQGLFNLVKDTQTMAIREGLEAILRPPVGGPQVNRTIVGRYVAPSPPKQVGVGKKPTAPTPPPTAPFVKKKPVELKSYDQFIAGDGHTFGHVFTVKSTRHRFSFGGPANVELSFDVSQCFLPGGEHPVATTIGLEFGLDHAGAGSDDTHQPVPQQGSSKSNPVPQPSGSKSKPIPARVMPTLDDRLYDPYDLKQTEVSSATETRSTHFLQLRDAILGCLQARFKAAGAAKHEGEGFSHDYFRIAGFKASAFAAAALYDGNTTDRRDAPTDPWPKARFEATEILARPPKLKEIVSVLRTAGW